MNAIKKKYFDYQKITHLLVINPIILLFFGIIAMKH